MSNRTMHTYSRDKYIQGTTLTHDDVRKISLQIIAVRLRCGYPISRQQQRTWHYATADEQQEAYDSIDVSELTDNSKTTTKQKL